MNWPVQKKEVIPIIQTSVFLHFAQKIGKVNTMLLFENVFKDNNEKVVEILNNTKDPKIFYDLSDSLNII